LEDLVGVRVLPRGLLGIDQLSVDGDLEGAAARGDQGYLGRRVFELFEDLGRQTDGLVEIASDRAVLDRDLHPSRLTEGGRACETASRLC
jgi:hypothetical protein